LKNVVSHSRLEYHSMNVWLSSRNNIGYMCLLVKFTSCSETNLKINCISRTVTLLMKLLPFFVLKQFYVGYS